VTENVAGRIPLSDRSRIVVSPQQLSCDLAGEAAMVNLTTGVYFGVDAVGARIWSLIREETTFGDVRDALMKTYDVDAGRLESDLSTFLLRLAEHGLIEIR